MSVFQYMSKEKIISLSVIASIFTYRLINVFLSELFNPLCEGCMPLKVFDCMTYKTKHGEYRFGYFIRELLIWFFAILMIYLYMRATGRT